MLDSLSDFVVQHPFTTGVAGFGVLLALLRHSLEPPLRIKRLSPTAERVLIIGATSGVGRKLANLYAKRGAKLCIVGRRGALLDDAKAEFLQSEDSGHVKPTIIAKAADITSPEDLVAVREYLEQGEHFQEDFMDD